MSEQDSLNEKEVISILDEHRWVGKSLVGGQANMTLWLVIQHAEVAIQEKYLSMLRQSVEEEESSGRHLALLEDRILLYHGGPQIYGSQIVTDSLSGKQIVYPVENPENVNNRRQSVGLEPIEVYVKRFGIEWHLSKEGKKYSI